MSVSKSILDKLTDSFYHNHLFRNLNILEIMKLKLVSKKFYSLVESYKVDQLAFLEMEDSFCFENNRWFTTNEPLKITSYINTSNLPVLIMPPVSFFGLKYLKIKETDSQSINFKDINKFAQIEILEIDLDTTVDDLIRLPELKALSLKYSRCFNGSNLVIDAPMLKSLLVGQLRSYFKFEHPLSVKYLRCEFFRQTTLVFENLECLEIVSPGRDTEIIADNLKKFNHLKQLKIYDVFEYKIDEVRDLFLGVKDSLEVFLKGIKIRGIDKFNELVQSKDEFGDIKDHLENYEDLDDYLALSNRLSYCSLEDLSPNSIYPSDLFAKKYTNIQKLFIYREVKDENLLIRVIKECPTLSYIEIEKSSLSQEFYDQLSEICNLFYLVLHDESNILNCDFIMNLQYLQRWHTFQDVRINEKLHNFKYFLSGYFKINRKKVIHFIRSGKDEYTVYGSRAGDEEFFSLKELIEWLDNLRQKM